MINMTIDEARSRLMSLQRKMAAYEHAMGIIYYDGVTTAPKDTAENRAVSMSVLSEEIYRQSTSDETVELLEFLDANAGDLTADEQRMVYLLLKDRRVLFRSISTAQRYPRNEEDPDG